MMHRGRVTILVGAVWACALAVGCFNPNYPTGLPCDGVNDCPPGQLCIDQKCATTNDEGCAPGEACNGIDDDCDDLVDEGLDDNPPAICTQITECAGTIAKCTGTGGWVCQYGGNVSHDGLGNIVQESDCDGIDNDCDGVIDDAYPTLGDACTVGSGGCQTSGTVTCNSTMTGIECNAPLPPGATTEVCNGEDDDCDGVVDGITETCSSACGSGTRTCTNGSWGACSAPQPSAEVCNNYDDDCNGVVDSFTEACSSACGSGTRTCTNGSWGACNAPQPSAEVCNNYDDDCNGITDDPGTCVCELFTNSNYGSYCMTVTSNTSDLHAYGCGDKVSSVKCYNGTSVRLYIDKNYTGSSWIISGWESSLHTSNYGNLGDNASSARIIKQ